MEQRLNIGLFIDDIDAVFTSEAVKGAELGAIAINANLYIFPGMYLDSVSDISDDHMRYEYQYNTLFQFADENHLDILYVMMGMIGARISQEERVAFLKQYLNIPIVNLYTQMEEYPSIIFDNQTAFMQAIRHLITDHHVTKVGYVSGPKTNIDAMERLEAYKKVLAETGIPYNEDYVIYGNFEESSEEIIGTFVAAHPEIRALAFANDRMALGGYHAFEKMNLKVGQDILVVSFDNSSFAPNLTPPLTTVEANAAELSYKAVANAEYVIKHKRLDDIRVDTHFIKRSSCGCPNFSYQTVSERLGIRQMLKEGSHTALLKRIQDYLFGEYAEGNTLRQIKDDLAVFMKILCDMITENQLEAYEKDINIIFSQIISRPIFRYTTAELFFDVLMALQYDLRESLPDAGRQLKLMELFSGFYRELAIINWQVIQGQQEGMEQMTRLINNMTVDMFRPNGRGQIPYERALDDLSAIGMKSAWLFTYEKPIYHPKNLSFKRPDHMLLRAYLNENRAFGVPDEQQMISSGAILNHPLMPQNRRKTMVLSPLFSCEELYGVLVSEMHYTHFRNLEPVTVQISIALRSLLLLEEQNKIHKQLQKNLAQMSENNVVLSEISKTDQLTGLYNRWGFMENVHSVLSNPRNSGKELLVLYADMDNLKMINDNYGHDDGDFALTEIAAILKEAFRSTDIIARFGGDEFVALALFGIPDFENIMKRRIAEITERHNQMAKKPYRIDMSCGICEVICDPSLEINNVLEIADRKLYMEKKKKKEQMKVPINTETE